MQSVSQTTLYPCNLPHVKIPTHQAAGHSLSVVSAPAPVAQRLDVTGSPVHRQNVPPPALQQRQLPVAPDVGGLRSTKSQRIRGATNNMRMKQMEMRESHAVVYS